MATHHLYMKFLYILELVVKANDFVFIINDDYGDVGDDDDTTDDYYDDTGLGGNVWTINLHFPHIFG